MKKTAIVVGILFLGAIFLQCLGSVDFSGKARSSLGEPTATRPWKPYVPGPTATKERYQLALLSSRGSPSRGGGYFVVEGQVKNISKARLEDIIAMATVYDNSDTFISYDEALIEYTVLLPQQVSPFSVMVDYNPAIERYRIEFVSLGGLHISTRDDRAR